MIEKKIIITKAIVNCYIANFGQTATSFEITVNEAEAIEGLKSGDFTIHNAVINFEYAVSENTKVNSVIVKGNKIILNTDEILIYKCGGEGPLTGKPLYIECNTHKINFSFQYSDLEKKTTIIDDFIFNKFEGIEYFLYTPKDTSKAQPLMVYLHGNEMAGRQLIFGKATSYFASDEIQAKQQCYVFAPTSMINKKGMLAWNSDEIDTVVRFVRKLISEGKVDPARVYIQGNSMGGSGTLNALLAYPDVFAAAMPMCGTVFNEGNNRSIFESKAKRILHMPIWILHAKNDTVVKFEDSKYVYDYLIKNGAAKLKATWIEDDVLSRHGIYFAHAADILTTYMPEVADWFFNHHK